MHTCCLPAARRCFGPALVAMAVQDAHNLAWKVAAVHHGVASPDLLLSYEAGVT